MANASKTYTGSGELQSIIGLGFQPVAVWFRNLTTGETARWEAHANGEGEVVSQATGDDVLHATGGITPTADGFDVGSNTTINGDGHEIECHAEGPDE